MLHVTREGAAEIWTVDRPAAANAIDRVTVDALAQALAGLERALAEGGGPRGLIIASAPRAPGLRPVFLSGADLGELETVASPDAARAFSAHMTGILRQVEQLPILVIAAIAGDVYGGGCELITACDLRIAERGIQLSFRQARMGLSTGWGGSTRLVHLVGLGAAKRLLLTGLPCEADEALRLGLVDELVDPGAALGRARDLVAATAQGARGAVTRLKRGLHDAVVLERDASYARELDRFVESWSSDEHRAALAARRQKKA